MIVIDYTSLQKTMNVPANIILADKRTRIKSDKFIIWSVALRGGCLMTSLSTGSTPRLQVL